MIFILKDKIRSYIYYEYMGGKTAIEAYKSLQQLPPQWRVSRNTVKRWYKRFSSGDHSLNDHKKTGRPITVDTTKIFNLIELEPTLTSTELAAQVGCSRSTANHYLNKKGYTWKYAKWIPHELTPKNLKKRYDISVRNILTIDANDLNKRLVTMDETMICFKNYRRQKVYRKPSQAPITQPKQPKHPTKVMLSIWWDCDGVICYHLLNKDEKIDSFKYRSQLYLFDYIYRSSRAHKIIDGTIWYHHDNASPHTAKITKEALADLGYKVLEQPPYSPDLAPSDYFLFRDLYKQIGNQKFKNVNEVDDFILEWIQSKPKSFFQAGINSLQERYVRCIQADGNYF